MNKQAMDRHSGSKLNKIICTITLIIEHIILFLFFCYSFFAFLFERTYERRRIRIGIKYKLILLIYHVHLCFYFHTFGFFFQSRLTLFLQLSTVFSFFFSPSIKRNQSAVWRTIRNRCWWYESFYLNKCNVYW